MAKPPKPDPDLVNLGAILDQPFLYQSGNPSTVKMPSSQAFVTVSTLIPSGSAEGTAAYTFGPKMELVKEIQTTSGAVKTTDFLYSPPDMTQVIASLEARLEKDEATLVELQAAEGVADEDVSAARERRDVTREKLAKAKKQKGSPAPRLQRTKWLEVGDGDLTVSGETVFEYDGPDIVKSLSTITTAETPPRVDQLETEYRYNSLGQVSEIDTAGSVTTCEYDELGRLAKKSGGFVSPAGDFLADHRTVFAYSPPVGDPNQIPPPNALLSSVNDSISGPLQGFEETPQPMKAIPEPTPPTGGAEKDEEGGWLSKLLGGATATETAPTPAPPLEAPKIPGSLDTTRVQTTYMYP